MKKKLLEEIIDKKKKKNEFAIITNLDNGISCIFEKNRILDKNFEKYKKEIDLHISKKKKWSPRRNKYFYRNICASN